MDRSNRISGWIAYGIKYANQGWLLCERLASTEMGNAGRRNRFVGRVLFGPLSILNAMIHSD